MSSQHRTKWLTDQNQTKFENSVGEENRTWQCIRHMYVELLEELENGRIEFERKLNAEKQKWQEALNVSKLENEMMEMKMKEQMEKWTEEQQAEWKNVMESRVNAEKYRHNW